MAGKDQEDQKRFKKGEKGGRHVWDNQTGLRGGPEFSHARRWAKGEKWTLQSRVIKNGNGGKRCGKHRKKVDSWEPPFIIFGEAGKINGGLEKKEARFWMGGDH